MTQEELLKPRYKVIVDWPGNRGKIGDVFTYSEEYGSCVNERTYDAELKTTLEKYPHLFKKLEWWEDRRPEDLPEYVKYWDTSLYFPVDRVCIGKYAPFDSINFTAENFHPATEKEYLEYNQTHPGGGE